MRNLISITLFIICIGLNAQVRYANVTTQGTGDGTSEANAWSLTTAFASATAGMTVWVKAGDYVITSNLYPNNGTIAQPIRFIGYKTSINDIISTTESTITYTDYKTNGDDLDPTEMPLIRRASKQLTNSNATSGVLLSYRSYVELYNLQFKWQYVAIDAFQCGNGIVLKNIVAAWMGNFDPNDSWNGGGAPFDPAVPPEATAAFGINQAGQGIALSTSNSSYSSLIENCTVFNPGHIGILVGTIGGFPQTQNATIRGCKVYSDQNINPADYYIEFYNVQYGLIENSSAYRKGDLTHQGHGIDLKRNCANNIVRNCYIENTFLELTLSSNNNTIEDVEIKSFNNYLYNYIQGGIKNYAGAHTNTYKNLELINTNGILFADVWDESNTPTNAGHDNIFINCIVHNSQLYNSINTYSPISFESNTALESHPAGNYNATSAYNNKFYNCTFDTSEALFTVNRPNSGNELINCSVSNIPLVYSARSWGDALNMTYTSTNFYNSQVPGGYTNLGLTADYTDSANDNFSLLGSVGGLKDAGQTTVYTYDILGEPRPYNSLFDIGAYEYTGGAPSNVPVTGVTVSPTNAQILTTGSVQYTATVLPANATDKTGTWSSTLTGVATINSSTGLASGVGVGTTSITFTTTDGSFTDPKDLDVVASLSSDAIGVLNPVAYGNPSSIDPSITVDGSIISVWEDLSGLGNDATSVGANDLNLSGTDRMAEYDGSSYFETPIDINLDFVGGTDEITYIAREGDVVSSSGGYLLGKGNSSNREYGITYVSGAPYGAYAGGLFNFFSNVPQGTNRLFIVTISTTETNAWINGVQVISGGVVGTLTASGTPLRIGSLDGTYNMSAGSQMDLFAVIPSAITTQQRLAIESEFIFSPTPIATPLLTLRNFLQFSNSRIGYYILGANKVRF